MNIESGLEHLKLLPDWDHYFLGMLPQIMSRSKDKHTKVGCLIVNQFNNIISTGYNSLPAGIDDNVPERYERPLKYEYLVHAEENAICAAAKAGIALYGSKIYQGTTPCINCARMIIQAGIKEIICNANTVWTSQKYDDAMAQRTKQMLFEAQVSIRSVEV